MLVAFLVVLMLTVVIICALFATVFANRWDCLGELQFKPSTGELRLQNSEDQLAIKGFTGRTAKLGSITTRRSSSISLEYNWDSSVSLVITKEDKHCYNVTWSAKQHSVASLMDCFDISDMHLYGGSELYRQVWPLEKASVEMQPYFPLDTLNAMNTNSTVYGSVLERLWFTSKGGVILVDNGVPLHVSLNQKADSQLCLKAEPTSYPRISGPLQLIYKLCFGSNAKDVRNYAVETFFSFPASIPDKRMIREPIWSTWARYKKNVNQSTVLNFAKEIKKYGFPCSQIEIDDKYSTAYGDFDFNVTKFPDADQMVQELHRDNFRVTAWVHPFANTDSKAFKEGMPYWVKGKDAMVPGLVEWWDGIAGILDTTDTSGREWFQQRLEKFKSIYNLDSFKFDAGELGYLPEGFQLKNITKNNPCFYSTSYVKMAAHFGSLVEVRVGYQSQNFPVFVRMMDKDSRWDENNGLRSLIPTALTFGILGYPFILPDMIGGNAYCEDQVADCSAKPEKELYIRWLQATVFLPAMQFSIPPWDYDNETVNIAKEMMSLRRNVSDAIIQSALEATQNGAPIIRPIWWMDPDDPVAQKIDSEFMVGDHYLVAPVLTTLQENQGKHMVYLPKGSWKEGFGSMKVITAVDGGKWLEYNVTLKDLPYFSCVSPKGKDCVPTI